jgi:NtrC-family two-component system sensor histidine kinase KinB
MKIKVKLRLGVGLLFIFIMLLSVLGTVYINALNKDTQNILVANYNTLDYSREMLMALDNDMTSAATISKFAGNLSKQENNITEIGEKELTDQLAQDFEKVKADPRDNRIYIAVRKDLADIMLLNMQAILRKSNIAKQTAATAILWIGLSGTFCFVIAFVLLINLPSSIADPIAELTNSIKQVAAKKYSERVHFESHGEFGQLAAAFNTMAQKLEEYDNSTLSKIMFEKQRIETLINNMHDPVIGLDEKKTILFVNNEALKILGMKSGEVTGKPAQDVALTNDLMRSLVQDLVLPPDNRKAKEPLKIYADSKESYFEKELIVISITPTGEKEPQRIGHFIVLRNITPFKELDFAKTNFIATISHELKTPISTIKASVHLLENTQTGPINTEQKQLIESIKEDSNRLLKITSELLQLSQVETGNIQLSIQQSDPSTIIQYALEAVRITADQKQVRLEVKTDGAMPAVRADTEKTAWVLINLLTNAIRYSPEKSTVLITVKKNKEADTVSFSVKDVGQGINEKYKDKIFTRYFQIPGSSKSGTGLGLAISKEFIEAQGGKIAVESDPGAGSTFTFTLHC